MRGRPRLLIFDLDGTLYSQAKLRGLLLPRLAAFSLRRPAAGWRAMRILRAHRAALERLRGEALPHRLPEAQVEETCRAAGYGRREVEECLERWFHLAPLGLLRACIRPGLAELLALGIPSAVWSDYDPAPKLEAMGLASSFAAALGAADARVQALKPHPRGLEVLLEQFATPRSRAVYFGDRPALDGAAAKAAGVRFELIGRSGFGAAARRIVTEYAL